jgi:hypothetical protein
MIVRIAPGRVRRTRIARIRTSARWITCARSRACERV